MPSISAVAPIARERDGLTDAAYLHAHAAIWGSTPTVLVSSSAMSAASELSRSRHRTATGFWFVVMSVFMSRRYRDTAWFRLKVLYSSTLLIFKSDRLLSFV